jgi:ubiquinone/menaquinone biosynthesis C-methylase UbiE
MVAGDQDGNARKRRVAAAYDRLAPDYDRIGPRLFSHFGARLVAFAPARPGTAVLDVAAGRGAVLFPAAERVGEQGRVIGIDLAAAMVRHTAAELHHRGLQQAEVRRMDAERLRFADRSFDAVLCGFALHHFPRPARALAEFHRVLRPGGTAAVATWAERPALFAWLREALKPYDDVAQLMTRAFDTPDDLAAALREAGFVEVRVAREAADVVYADEEEWWASNWAFLQRAALERLAPAALGQVKAAAFAQVQGVKQADGVHQRWGALLAAGSKPQH